MSSDNRILDPANNRPTWHPLSFGPIDAEGGVRAGYFRTKEITDDSIFNATRQELGDARMLEIMQQGDQELRTRKRLHEQVIGLLSSILGGLKLDQNLVLSLGLQHKEPFADRRGPRDHYPLEGSELDMLQIIHDQELYPSSDNLVTLRRLLLMRALRIMDARGEAMTHRDRQLLGETVDYASTQTLQESLVVHYLRALTDYYQIPAETEAISLLTAKGAQASNLALAVLFNQYPGVDACVVGDLYYGTEKFLNRLAELNIPQPNRLIRINGGTTDIAKQQIGLLRNKERPVVFLVDPIENSTEMHVNDIRAIANAAAEKFQAAHPFFLVLDLTTTAGMFSFYQELIELTEKSALNVITVQSLIKYFNYGLDLVPMGYLSAFGSEFVNGSQLRQQLHRYYSYFGMGPAVSQVAMMPPLLPTYLQFRARQIERNALILTTAIQNEFGPNLVRVIYPGLCANNRQKLANIGFSGGFFFMELPDNKALEVVKFVEQRQNENEFGRVESGSSFGFDRTRLSAISPGTLRVVPGTEDIMEAHFISTNLRKILRTVLF